MTFCDHDLCTTTAFPFAAERDPLRACLAAVAVACPFADTVVVGCWGEWPFPAACALPLPLVAALVRRVGIAGRSEGDARVETGDWERRAPERKGSLVEEWSPRRLGSCFRLSWKASFAGIMLRCAGVLMGDVARWGTQGMGG